MISRIILIHNNLADFVSVLDLLNPRQNYICVYQNENPRFK